MKKFDLKAALSGEPVKTGTYNTIFVFDKLHTAESSVWRKCTQLEFKATEPGHGIFVSDLDGKTLCTDLQLVMAPKKQTVWVNLYWHFLNSEQGSGYFYPTKEIAERMKKSELYIGTFPIEFEE
jgi:hypothetical protein